MAALFLSGAAIIGSGLALRQRSSSPAPSAKARADAPSSTPPAKQTAPLATPSQGSISQAQMNGVKDAVSLVVQAHSGLVLGVSMTDMTSGSHMDINGSHVFTAASTAKLIPACLFLSQVESGSQGLSRPLGDFTAQDQLKQMINQSNDDSWALFNTLLTYPSEEAFARQLGMDSYDSQNNLIAPNDTVILLTQLYQGKLLNAADTSLLLSFMQDTNEEGLIPAGLPEGYAVYHKYGELDDNVHDVGIISDGIHTYALAIYSNGEGDEDYDARAATFHDIEHAIINSLGTAS